MTTLAECTALIIDPNPTSRSVLSAQLRDAGMSAVIQCGRVVDARRHLETREFDIVLCEMDFHGGTPHSGVKAQTGQELLDELRSANLLPWSTVFIMVTGERSYAKVAEAAESALDSYLLKPFTTTALHERMMHARQRKRVLKDIYTAIEDNQFELAARLCTERFRRKEAYWLYAARLGAELLLRLEMHTAARELLDSVVAHQALPWARLGIARAQLGAQQTTPALRSLESLIADEPSYVDAYDVLGRTQVAQGHLGEAMATYQKAADLTPSSLRRQQKLGMLAFYSGDQEAAAKALDRAVILGQNSKLFDLQTVVLLAIVRFRQRDSKALGRCATDMARALEKAPQSKRLQRMSGVVSAFDLMMRRQVAQVIGLLKRLASETRARDFDIEAACNLLTALAQLTAAELNLEDAEGWVEKVGQRFTGAKGVSELLACAAGAHTPFSELIKRCHTQVAESVEKAMTHCLAGRPDAAFEALIAHARVTMNQKFVDTARGVLKRYGEKMSDVPRHQAALDELAKLLGARPAPVATVGMDDEGLGGIRIRAGGKAADEAPAAQGGGASALVAAPVPRAA